VDTANGDVSGIDTALYRTLIRPSQDGLANSAMIKRLSCEPGLTLSLAFRLQL